VGESLAPGVQPLLAELGVWQDFVALRALPSYGTRSIWGHAAGEEQSHLMSPWGTGWHVDRLAFDVMLSEHARQAGARVVCGVTLAECTRQGSGWALKLAPGESGTGQLDLRAGFLVDATGRRAHVAQRLGARRTLADHLVAVCVRFEGLDTAEQGYVMVEATSDGWWYTAPIPGRGMMVALMTDGDLYARARAQSPSAWWSGWDGARATRGRVDGGTWRDGPHVVSAVSQRLRRSERSEPWLAVGDAALSVDPISGSGIPRGLRSARAASETVLAFLQGQGPATIATYEDLCDRNWVAYLQERASCYELEQRWADAAFWQRRMPRAAA
jgi:flavin-dependent dehydrogenase